MDILDDVAFVLQPRAPGACPWLHSQAIERTAARLVDLGRDIAQHPLVTPGQLSPIGAAALSLAESYDTLGEMLACTAHQVRRNAMAERVTGSQEPDLSEPRRPHLTLLPGGLDDGDSYRKEEPSDYVVSFDLPLA